MLQRQMEQMVGRSESSTPPEDVARVSRGLRDKSQEIHVDAIH